MKTCLAIVGTLTGFARFFAFAIVALLAVMQSLAAPSKGGAIDAATIPDGMQWGVTFGFYGSEEIAGIDPFDDCDFCRGIVDFDKMS